MIFVLAKLPSEYLVRLFYSVLLLERKILKNIINRKIALECVF